VGNYERFWVDHTTDNGHHNAKTRRCDGPAVSIKREKKPIGRYKGQSALPDNFKRKHALYYTTQVVADHLAIRLIRQRLFVLATEIFQ
jgi:hypothetical protein